MESSYWAKVTRERIGRRRLLMAGAGISAGAAALALVGCGGDDEGGAGGEGGEPKPGGTLRFAMSADITNLEPHQFILAQGETLNQVWDTLARYEVGLKLKPQLAESWEINKDATEFVFHLRKGVKFHSGRELTSEDLKFNMERVRATGTAFGQLRSFALLYDSFEAPNPSTFVLKSAIPRPATFDFIEYWKIGDRETLDKDKTKAIGTGPYMLAEWRPGDRLRLLKNPNYFQSGQAFVDEQVFQVMDEQTGVAQLESGAVDVNIRTPIRDFVRLKQDKAYEARLHSTPGSYYALGWNSVGSGGTPKAFRDKRVRQALNWALNREYFCETLLQGTSLPYSLPWPKASLAYEEEKVNRYKFDLDKTKSLLSAAAVNPADLQFGMIMTVEQPELKDLGQVYQADLAKIGIKTSVEPVEVAQFVNRINADPPNYNGMWVSGSGFANLGAPITMVNLTNVLFGPDKGGQFDGVTWGDNNTGYYSDRYANLVSTINKETDEAKLKKLYSEFNDILLDDSWIGFLASRPSRIVRRSRVKGISEWFIGTFNFSTAWLAQ